MTFCIIEKKLLPFGNSFFCLCHSFVFSQDSHNKNHLLTPYSQYFCYTNGARERKERIPIVPFSPTPYDTFILLLVYRKEGISMQGVKKTSENEALNTLCLQVRQYIITADYDTCYKAICRAMEAFPDSPHPHNLLGILLEKTGQHASAMRHFRAAYALDPTYIPVRQNLETYGTFYSTGKCAFDETDCTIDSKRMTSSALV